MNGPSLTSSTAITAPNRPVATRTPIAAERLREPEVEPLRQLRGRGAGEPGPPAAAGVGVERELAHDERLAADVEQRQVRPALRVVEDPQLRRPAGRARRHRLVVVRPDAEEDRRAPARSRRRPRRRRGRGRRSSAGGAPARQARAGRAGSTSGGITSPAPSRPGPLRRLHAVLGGVGDPPALGLREIALAVGGVPFLGERLGRGRHEQVVVAHARPG